MQLIRAHKSFAVLLATIVLMELAHGIEIVTLLPLLLTRHLAQGETFVGLVASVYLLVDTLLTRTPAGLLADRWGRKRTLALGILLSLLPVPLMAIVDNPAFFIPLSVVNGMGAGMVWPPIYALVADLYDRDKRGTVLGLVNMVMIGGLAAGGPISGSVILALLGYPDPSAFSRGFLVCGVLVLVALVLVIRFVREPRHVYSASAERGLSIRTLTLGPTFLRLLAIGLVITFALGLIVPILTLFGTNVLRVSLLTFALILIPPALTAAVVLIPAGRWADTRGRETPMLLGLGLIAIPFWGAALSTEPLIVSAGGMVAALGYALLVPAWNALIMDWIPDRRRGLFLGGIATVQGIGLAAGPVIGGRLFELNPYAPFWLAGTLLALGAALAAWVAYRPAQKESDPGGPLSDR